jgi:catechol 2,3-dioxygenase-like lactoylglutathione lyase family enzyme
MLADHTPTAAIATSDLARARAFYEGTLGFKPIHEIPEAGAITYEGGSGTFLLYASQYAGTNKATSMGFDIAPDAFESEIALLRSAGIAFETFDIPGLTWDDGIATMGSGRAAWFSDPDGNTIALQSGSMG